MITLSDLGSPVTFSVDPTLKQKSRKYYADVVKPISITPEQPSKQVYKVGQNED